MLLSEFVSWDPGWDVSSQRKHPRKKLCLAELEKIQVRSWAQWLMPVILATGEGEIRRIVV
jgi:hypothetical protein